MPHIELEINYNLRLTGAEFRLVTLALAGKLNSKDESRAALLLNERLCDVRARLTAQLSEVTAGAFEKASQLRDKAQHSEAEAESLEG